MSDAAWTWKVGRVSIPERLALLYADARQRVLASRNLRDHYYTIMDESWSSDEDHLVWVLRAKVSEIASWAKAVEDK
jgi:hypothetical protein